jgi:hypothetical protein
MQSQKFDLKKKFYTKLFGEEKKFEAYVLKAKLAGRQLIQKLKKME